MKNMLQAIFINVAKKYGSGPAFSDSFCPDKWFRVHQMRSSTSKLPYQDMINFKEGTLERRQKIVIVLESPHIDEFEPKGHPCPANGKTGRFLRSFWGKIFGDDYNDKDIVLVNAIQYQCSLGFSPIDGLIRDSVFQELLAKPCFACDFRKRVSNVICPGDIVLNACTTGRARIGKKNNKEMVSEVLGSGGWCVINVAHPASWLFQWRKVREAMETCVS